MCNGFSLPKSVRQLSEGFREGLLKLPSTFSTIRTRGCGDLVETSFGHNANDLRLHERCALVCSRLTCCRWPSQSPRRTRSALHVRVYFLEGNQGNEGAS